MASRFAVAIMLLLDRADSPGLLIRPRPGRPGNRRGVQRRRRLTGGRTDGHRSRCCAAGQQVSAAMAATGTGRPATGCGTVRLSTLTGRHSARICTVRPGLSAAGPRRHTYRPAPARGLRRAARATSPYVRHREDLALVDHRRRLRARLPMERAEPAPAAIMTTSHGDHLVPRTYCRRVSDQVSRSTRSRRPGNRPSSPFRRILGAVSGGACQRESHRSSTVWTAASSTTNSVV